MIPTSRLIKISKYLSYHLRHHPEELGLKVASGGWVPIDALLKASEKHSFIFTRQELDKVVEKNDKKRFSFDETGTLIRANQGHSIEVDLHLTAKVPPAVLYHGTKEQAVASILQKGLCRMTRHHVHLSTEIETAQKVGQRHGSPVVFRIDAASMNADGYEFYCSENGVWLVDSVPVKYLKKI